MIQQYFTGILVLGLIGYIVLLNQSDLSINKQNIQKIMMNVFEKCKDSNDMSKCIGNNIIHVMNEKSNLIKTINIFGISIGILLCAIQINYFNNFRSDLNKKSKIVFHLILLITSMVILFISNAGYKNPYDTMIEMMKMGINQTPDNNIPDNNIPDNNIPDNNIPPSIPDDGTFSSKIVRSSMSEELEINVDKVELALKSIGLPILYSISITSISAIITTLNE